MHRAFSFTKTTYRSLNVGSIVIG